MSVFLSDSLVFRVEADFGVSVTNGVVTGWTDQSSSGNDLDNVQGNPTINEELTPTGLTSISFDGGSDGSDDSLQRLGGITNFSAGSEDRTVFLVAKFDNAIEWGGFVYGDDQKNETFGITTSDDGFLSVQGYGRTNDFSSSEQSTGEWMVIAAVLSDSSLTLYQNGVPILENVSHTFNTDPTKIVLADEIGGRQAVDINIAAALTFNTALTQAEFAEANSFLTSKYITEDGVDDPPVAQDDSVEVVDGGMVEINVLANDIDDGGALDPSSISIITPPSRGSLTVDQTTGVITYNHDGFGLDDLFSYTVFDSTGGGVSNEATVAITVDVDDPPVASDDSVTLVAGTQVQVDILANDSDDGNSIDASSIAVTAQPTQGDFFVSSGGIITYTHTGVTGVDTLSYTVADNTGGGVSAPATVSFNVVGNSPPDTNADLFVLSNGSSQSLNVLANDTDDLDQIDETTVAVAVGPQFGSTSIDPVTGVINYTHDGSGNPDSFAYTVEDESGNISPPTDVTISIGVQPNSLEDFVDEGVITSGLGQPVSLAFLPDNRMLVIQKGGQILISDPETGAFEEYMDLTVNSQGERGLLDITLDPDFEQNGHFYLFYTPEDPQNAVISRFTHQENSGGLTSRGDLSSEFGIWQDTDSYVTCCHYGGGLDFGPDEKLWLTSSDKFNTSNLGEGNPNDDWPVDLTSTSGKVIRINKDGSIPDGTDGFAANPYIDASGDPNDEIPDSIWAYGLRNPFRSSFDLETGNLYMAEVGGNQTGLSSEDLHIASLDQPGVFYGWPFYEGADTFVYGGDTFDPSDFPAPDNDLGDPANGDFYSAPIFTYDRGNGGAITGGFVYRGDAFPDEWDGVYFYGDYSRDFIRYLKLDSSGEIVLGDYDFKPTAEIPGDATTVVFLGEGEDGALYYINYSGNGGQVRRIVYQGNFAPVVDVTVDNHTGPLPFEAAFNLAFTDDDTPFDQLTYSVNFGDGTTLSDQAVSQDGTETIVHTYSTEGNYSVSVSVSDGISTTFSQPEQITAGDPNDAPQIVSNVSDTDFVEVGESVTFSTIVTDPDLSDPPESLTYTWDFGDGSPLVSGNPDAAGNVTVTHNYTDGGIFNARVTIDDGEIQTVSDELRIRVGDQDGLIFDGLVGAWEAFIKVGTEPDGTTVNGWIDESGLGNSLITDTSSTNNPQYIQNATPTGLPAIAFDGDGDFLFRDNTTENPIDGLAEGDAARSMFFVVDYMETNRNTAGMVYGTGDPDNAFGLVTHGRSGEYTIQGWGGKNDNRSGVDGITGGFVSHSVVMQDGGDYIHYVDGVQVDSGSNDFNTIIDRIAFGQEIGGGGESAMMVAGAFIYDKALSEGERLQMETYITNTYLDPNGSGNTAPDTLADAFNMTEGNALNVAAANGVLANDTDVDGDVLSAILGTGPSNGTLTLNPDGSFLYEPEFDFFGQDSFDYIASDGVLQSSPETVTIDVENVEDAPIAVSDTYTTSGPLNILAAGVLANDTDADGDVLTASLISGPANGSLTLDADGGFDYLPNNGFLGSDSFSYVANDGLQNSAPALVTIVVNEETNLPPIATNDSYQSLVDSVLVVDAASGLLSNDSDPEGGSLQVTEIDGVEVSNGEVITLSLGDLQINSTGSLQFSPVSGLEGLESFAYTVSDGVNSVQASAQINVAQPSTGIPVLNGLIFDISANENVTFAADGSVNGWLDGSGNGNDLRSYGTADNAPELQLNATPTGSAAIYFDGDGDYLARDIAESDPLVGFEDAQGIASRSMFFVVDYLNPNNTTAGLVYGRGSKDNAFGLATDSRSDEFMIQGWGRRNDNTSDVESVSLGFVSHSVVMQDGGDYIHYVNGEVIDTGNNDFDTILDRLVIGQEISDRGESEMSVAAVLIYDRALDESERLALEDYLRDTYLEDSIA